MQGNQADPENKVCENPGHNTTTTLSCLAWADGASSLDHMFCRGFFGVIVVLTIGLILALLDPFTEQCD